MQSLELEELYRSFTRQMHKIGKEEQELVFSSGSKHAKVMLIGEAPGKNEVLQKKPFVGKAGANLESFLEGISLKREELFVTNTVKFRPYRISPKGTIANRPPTRKEVEICADYLLREIDIVRPRLIVSLGNIALGAVGQDRSLLIGQVHGQMLSVSIKGIAYPLYPLYHPASILYNPKLKSTYLKDMEQLKHHIAALDSFS